MIRVDRDPAVCGPLTTEPGRTSPTAQEQVDAFKAQLDRGIDRDAIDRLSDEEVDTVTAILGKIK